MTPVFTERLTSLATLLLEPYRFSFTAASAMISEFVTMAKSLQKGVPLDELQNSITGREKKATYSREFRELKLRIQTLTEQQIEILAEGTPEEQKQITHLALCKSYGIYHDFVSEVLAEKLQVFDHTITDLDYNSFISRKKMDHPKLENLADTTQKKVKQVIFRMLQQVGLIDSRSNPSILYQNLTTKTETAIVEDNPKWLACFLYPEHQIKSLL